MKRAVLLLALPLSGCVHVGLPGLGGVRAPPAPAPAAAPPICPGGLSADLPPEPQVRDYAGAGLVRATTAAESAALVAYSTFTHDYGVWARLGWQRAAAAKAFCDGAPK